ncbi:hypothetical protein XENTR_v10019300 [Xenopus tropicalis]|uniref:BCL2-like 12 (proline rich) n=1 Tax=Xenopus tropicalis TaxID=8364 RepID=A0A6I8QHD4_XENTR|nr:bcl-2-like protein 12 [Xenopus tropicalis]KAE8593756.1 hypothetical protein XENTR_v10019300 [Xenopus tropicalis]KAE8593757.1 hypothetical protein XENTR_v10019300 [Xenopus tropicalis]
MDAIVNHNCDGISLIKVKEETKFVLEAFLKRSLSQEDASNVGHVGRTYHDPKKYSNRLNRDEGKEVSSKKPQKSEKKKSKEPAQGKDEKSWSTVAGGASAQEENGHWNSLHEEINRVEETKHDFKTNIKKLLRRNSQLKEKAASIKYKGGNIHSKSRDSLDNVLDDSSKSASKRDSLKRPKSPNPLLACTVAGSVDSLVLEAQTKTENPDKDIQGVQKKQSRPFSIKNILKKKQKDHGSEADVPHARPSFLPLDPCYKKDDPHSRAQDIGKTDEAEIYSLAAKKLDKLVKHQRLKSPTATTAPPFPPSAEKSDEKTQLIENNNDAGSKVSHPEGKDEVIRQLVVLLQEQANVINDKINSDPFLRNTLSRMSYGSFSKLAEVFTSQAEVPTEVAGVRVSPELTKIALTMELTRKVAGINSHAVHQLMGYSMAYMDMFVPWLQKQGGWENIISQDDIPDFQID